MKEHRHLLNRERPGLTFCGKGARPFYDRGAPLCPACKGAAVRYRREIAKINAELARDMKKACDVDPYKSARRRRK